MFLLPMPSDEPFHSPASFIAISIAGISFFSDVDNCQLQLAKGTHKSNFITVSHF